MHACQHCVHDGKAERTNSRVFTPDVEDHNGGHDNRCNVDAEGRWIASLSKPP